MKYLDETILITVKNLTVERAGQYIYTVSVDNGIGSTNLFTGSCFLTTSDSSKTFYMNDFVRSNSDLVANYTVLFRDLYYRGSNCSGTECCANIFRYPNKRIEPDFSKPIVPMIQTGLTPRVPRMNMDTEFKIAYFSNDDSTNKLSVLSQYDVDLPANPGYSSEVTISFSDIFKSPYKEIEMDGDHIARFPVAIIDECPTRYYVLWVDRFGSTQCQPFEQLYTYSETVTRDEMKNYLNERKIYDVSNQPTWKLNTGYLAENVYPNYEGIFVSPRVQLLDTIQNKVFNVIPNNTNFDEKTFKNQRKLFNLEITFELNKEQNNLY